MAWLDKTLKKIASNMDPIRQGKKLGEMITEKSQDVLDNLSGRKAAERLNKQSLEAWNMQNEYNTPANQVQRMLDAGLNPNLFYSQGTSGNANSAPEIAHTYDKAKFLNVALTVAQLSNILQQNANLKAQRDATEMNTAYRGLVNGSIQRWGMPPNMLTGLFSALENAGYSPESAIKITLDLFSKVGGFMGGMLGTGVGNLESLFNLGEDFFSRGGMKRQNQEWQDRIFSR